MRFRVLSAVLVLALVVVGGRAGRAGDAPRPAVPVLVVEQEISGIPGMAEDAVSRQRLTLDTAGKRVLLESLPDPRAGQRGIGLAGSEFTRVILRLDREPQVIYEVDDTERVYRVRDADLSRLQEERDQMELQLTLKSRSLPEAARRKVLAENHLRADGKREVTVRRGGTREILGHGCEEVIVTENGREVIRAWVTAEIEGGASFYELYRSLGAFSKEVLAKVRPIAGLPLAARITVVTAAPAYDIEARCTAIDRGLSVSPAVFDVSEEYRKVEQVSGIVACPICGSEMEWERPGGGIHFDPLTREEFRTCSKACKKTMRERLKARLDEAFRREAEGGKKAP